MLWVQHHLEIPVCVEGLGESQRALLKVWADQKDLWLTIGLEEEEVDGPALLFGPC